MESEEGNNWLPVNKKKLFPDNPVIGIGNIVVNANVIAFDHALEKVQNKLSLPEYYGSEYFEDTEKNNAIINEHEIKCISEPYNGNEIIKKQNKLSEMWKYQKSIKDFNIKNEKKMKSKSSIINFIQPKVKSKISTMKQMTLDKYSFQGNKTKSLKPSCSIMIACSNDMSIDNKIYSHQKVLYMGNSTNIQDLEKSYFSFPNLTTSVLSPWDERIVPSSLTLSTPMSRKLQTVTSGTKLCFNERGGEQRIGSVSLCSDFIEDDSLDIDIDAAIQKYEGGAQLPSAFEDVGVQTDMQTVHLCNCLRYHVCEPFRSLANYRCVEKREIAALDLDTLHHVLWKKGNGAYTLPDNVDSCIQKNTEVMRAVETADKQTQIAQDVPDSEMTIFSNNRSEIVAHSSMKHKRRLCCDNPLYLEQFVPELNGSVKDLEKSVGSMLENSHNGQIPCFENNILEESVLTKAFPKAANGGEKYEKRTYHLTTTQENDKYQTDELYVNDVENNVSSKSTNIFHYDKNNFVSVSRNGKEISISDQQQEEDHEEYVPDITSNKEQKFPLITKSLDKILGMKVKETKNLSSEAEIDTKLSNNMFENDSLIEDLSVDEDKGRCDSYIDYAESEKHSGSGQGVLTSNGWSEPENYRTCNDMDQYVPDTTIREKNTKFLPEDQDCQTAPGSWSGTFQWEMLSDVDTQHMNNSEESAQKSFEECLALKPSLRKRWRIGLSKRDKTVSLHPKRSKNL